MSEKPKAAATRTAKPRSKPSNQNAVRPVPHGRSASDRAIATAQEYPFALLLGGLALGVAVGAFLPRAAGRKLAKGALAAASVAGELGLIYGRQALEKAGEAAGSLDELKDGVSAGAADYSRKAASVAADLGSKAADIAGNLGRVAAERAGDALGAAGEGARDAGHKIGRQAIRLRSHLRH